MAKQKNIGHTERDLDAEAVVALEAARAMPHGPERTEAMKKAGILPKAADLHGIVFAKRGRPAKTWQPASAFSSVRFRSRDVIDTVGAGQTL